MKHPNPTKYAFALLAALLSLSSANAGKGREGGDSGRIDEAAIELLLTGGGLQKAMLRYVATLKVDQISDNAVRATFSRILKDNALAKEIGTPRIYRPRERCFDGYGNEVPASTVVGQPGGEICFDTGKLAAAYSELSAEEAMIRLASLAFHEHVHHFQDKARSSDRNQREANRLAGYVKNTAKIEQPLLKWSPELTAEANDYFRKLEHNGLYRSDSAVSGLGVYRDLFTLRVVLEFTGRKATSMVFQCDRDPVVPCFVVHPGETDYQSMTLLPDGNFMLNVKPESKHFSIKYRRTPYIARGTRTSQNYVPRDLFFDLKNDSNAWSFYPGLYGLHVETDGLQRRIYLQFQGLGHLAGQVMIFQCAPQSWNDCWVVEAAGTTYTALDIMGNGIFVLRTAMHSSFYPVTYFPEDML